MDAMNKVSRRRFCRWLTLLFPVGIITAIKLTKEAPPTFNGEMTYGYINAADPGGQCYKAYLNGQDVSSQTFEADDREGFVGIYEADVNGNIVWPLRSRRIYGRVKIVPIAKS